MTKYTTTLPTALVAVAFALAPAAVSRAQSTRTPEALDDRSKLAIEEALRDELRGAAFYARVLKDHGDRRPFSNVVRAERRHAAFLADLLKARGLAVPEFTDEAPTHASVVEACAAAVAFETTNVALYDRLIAAGPLPADVTRAFEHNRMASAEHHKPAFERCAGLASSRGTANVAGRAKGCGGCGYGGGCGGHGHHGCGHHGCRPQAAVAQR